MPPVRTHVQHGRILLHPRHRLVQELLQRQRLALERPQLDAARDVREVTTISRAATHRLQSVSVVLQVGSVHAHVLSLGWRDGVLEGG